MSSPTQIFVALPLDRVAEAVRGRLCGQFGQDYGPAPNVSRDEPAWALIAGACGVWILPAPLSGTKDFDRLKAFEKGIELVLELAVQKHQPMWVESVAGLLQALNLPPYLWIPSQSLNGKLTSVVDSAITALSDKLPSDSLCSIRQAVAATDSLSNPLLPNELLIRCEQIFGFAIQLCKKETSAAALQAVLEVWGLLLKSSTAPKPASSFQFLQLALFLRVSNRLAEAQELEREGLRTAWLVTRERPNETSSIQNCILNGASLLPTLVTSNDVSIQSSYQKNLIALVEKRWPEAECHAKISALPWTKEINGGNVNAYGLKGLRNASSSTSSYSERRSACLV
jgi:hypothetical protein